jgi:hypothetical protein
MAANNAQFNLRLHADELARMRETATMTGRSSVAELLRDLAAKEYERHMTQTREAPPR